MFYISVRYVSAYVGSRYSFVVAQVVTYLTMMGTGHCYSHQRTHNLMERYNNNRDFNNWFDSPKPGMFVRMREEV